MSTIPLIANESRMVEKGAASPRIPAFDFTKGALVLFMVLWHWLNYFYGTQGKIYIYLRFLTPSFIFITGFLISHVHFAKYGVGSYKLSKRLFLRGIKLLGVFVALNLLVGLAVPESFVRNLSSEQSILANLDAIFFSGRVNVGMSGKLASFGILVSISYVLMLAAMLSLACRYFKYSFHAACALLLLLMVLLDLRSIQSTNLQLVTVGLLGVVVGHASKYQVQRLVRHPWGIVLAYAVYLIVITVWNVSLYVQMIGAGLTTTLIYLIGVQSGRPNRLQEHIVLLGKYSLFAYVSQIAILQLLRASLRHVDLGPVALAASLVAGFALTMISVEATDHARSKSKLVDSLYTVIFA